MDHNWDIPTDIINESEKFFAPLFIKDAGKLLRQSKVTVSFSKGTLDNYFIVSGIIKDDKTHETKLTYKKRLEGTPEGPLSSNCDCKHWSATGHCPHVVSLFLHFHLKEHFHHAGETDGLPNMLTSTLGVHPGEYGTIIGSPSRLEGAPATATYTSVHYILTDKRIVPFPLPQIFLGKLIADLQTTVLTSETGNSILNRPFIRFSLQTENGERVDEISILENLYLFNWKEGKVYHLPSDMQDFVQKIRLHPNEMTFDEILQLSHRLSLDDQIVILIDGSVTPQIKYESVQTRVSLVPGDKKRNLSLKVVFYNEQEIIIPPPTILSAMTIKGGWLDSFKKKKDAYVFVENVCLSFKNGSEAYKKNLLGSDKRSKWLSLVSHLNLESSSTSYDSISKALYLYENDFIKLLINSLYECFGESVFRFSEYNPMTRELSFEASPAIIFQGLMEFHKRVTPHGVNIFYDRNQISGWSSRVRFERRSSATQWFDLELTMTKDDLEIIKNADLEQGLVLTQNGIMILTQEQKDLIRFMRKYTDRDQTGESTQTLETGEELHKFVLPFKRARIFELFELKKLGIEGALTPEDEALCQRLATLEEVPPYPLPEHLENVLRPYQRTGYNWLHFLYDSQLGACLADDMGLGKTLQAITFISSIYEKINSVLIVCPVTILINWEKEFKKFSNLPVHIYHGGERNFPDGVKIVITSYGVMKKEADDTFKGKVFDIFVMDEVQQLKNMRSLGAFSARKIEAKFRMCLTGTPVENDLAEFYNIIDLCVPGIWGDLQFIRTASNPETRFIARKTASPFILRRTKAQVLTDLPPKVDNTTYLEFGDTEKARYDELLNQIRSRIALAPSRQKYGEILKGLLQLRQHCLWQKDGQILSTKIDFLIETLEQILEEGHQVIVFSQFTTYLDIIEHAVREKHWKLSRIDGSQSVKKRQEQVDQFQEGKTPVFLISLKAGGVGLNLTAASYVFVMDPWWNPAVENQAIDRAHRIGQKNTLTVYRPIIKGSVEEKVLQLQEMKRQLFYDLLPENDDNYFTGKLSLKDFEMLFN